MWPFLIRLDLGIKFRDAQRYDNIQGNSSSSTGAYMLKPGASSQGHRADSIKDSWVSFTLGNVQNQLMKAYI